MRGGNEDGGKDNDKHDMLKISESYPESENKKKQVNNKSRYSKTPKPLMDVNGDAEDSSTTN